MTPTDTAPIDRLRVLLIQARGTLDMEAQERACFFDRTRLAPEQFAFRNVVRDALPVSLLDEVDAVLIGGAGEFSATREYPWMPGLLALIESAAAQAVPMFGCCWGHQVIARALGGRVVHDSPRAEFGCIDIDLTEAGQADELTGRYPAAILANAGHHDRVTALPEDAVELARSATQPNQIFRLRGLPIYGTQFHSELDAQRMRERLYKYRDLYAEELGGPDAYQHVLDHLAETSVVDGMLRDFLELFALPRSASRLGLGD